MFFPHRLPGHGYFLTTNFTKAQQAGALANKYHMEKVAWNLLFAATVAVAVIKKPQQPVPSYNLQNI